MDKNIELLIAIVFLTQKKGVIRKREGSNIKTLVSTTLCGYLGFRDADIKIFPNF